MEVRIKTRVTYNNAPFIAKTMRSDSPQVAYNTARRIMTDAKKRVHVITGKTRDSGRTERVSEGVHSIIFEHGAVWEEYGNRFRPAHPFLRPAVEAERAEFKKQLKGLFNHR